MDPVLFDLWIRYLGWEKSTSGIQDPEKNIRIIFPKA
jgi:hypothetical protein